MEDEWKNHECKGMGRLKEHKIDGGWMDGLMDGWIIGRKQVEGYTDRQVYGSWMDGG